ncbi:MAG: hypothetical protein ACT452_14800 [Microthrixaceae bacterium]
MASLSTRARATLLALVLLGAVGLPSIARADGIRVDAGTACVGNPPRQTFDPLSPPCVPYWDNETDNGGATYQGVTATEVRIAVVIDGGINYSGASDPTNRGAPRERIYDLAQDSNTCRAQSTGDAGCTHLTTEGLRTWQQYVNDRFQSYGRYLHFYAVFTAGTQPTPERRRAEAAWIVEEINPLAVVPLVTEGAEGALIEALNEAGVVSFADTILPSDEQLDARPGLAWNFGASAERAASSFSGFVCTKVVGKPAVRAGGELAGKPRVLGLVTTTDGGEPGRVAAAVGIRDGVGACDGAIADYSMFENCCLAQDNGDLPDAELADMVRFKLRGITTVLVAGAMNNNYFRAAQSIGYEPEWVLLGDGMLDNRGSYALAGDVVPGNTIVISAQVVEAPEPLCKQAYREMNSSTSDSDLSYTCDYYRPLFLMAVAVQVAGPNLTPTQVDKGLHAIPQGTVSTSPEVPTCWFATGEYSCVKDAHLGRWDPLGQVTPTSTPGCFRAVEGGRRYTADGWPAGNIDAQWSPTDPCSTYSASYRINLA